MICGSLMELKDSKSGSIASFNSTIPTKQKSLEEINVINGGDLVSRIAKILDGELALAKDLFGRPKFKEDRAVNYLYRKLD